MTLNRRDFLKALGVTSGAGALSACGLDDNQYLSPVENVLPYVVKPDQVVPGTPTFFATTVTRGPHAQPVLARHRDGRVVNVGANSRAPWGPAVSPSSFFELQRHYSPDRLKGPSRDGAEVTWEAGLEALAGAVKAARAAGKTVAYLGGYRSGTLVDLISDYTDGNAVFWEPLGYEAEAIAARQVFGASALPNYHLDACGHVLSFGAPFLSGWGASNLEDLYSKARNPNHGHRVARFSLVAPYRDQTGVNCDDFYGAKPGTEVLVARAIAGHIARERGASDIAALVGDATLEAASAASGVSTEALAELCAGLMAHDGVALPGGASGSAELAAATYLINAALGAVGSRVTLDGYSAPVHGWTELNALLTMAREGKIGVLLLDEANPVYALPADANVAEALAKVDMVVNVGSHPDETSSLAALQLPTSDTFEDWGDEEPLAGVWFTRQPAMTPLYNTRSLGDILLATARAAGMGAAAATEETSAAETEGAEAVAAPMGFTAENWKDYLVESWKRRMGGGDFTSAWSNLIIDGVKVMASAAAPTTVAMTSMAWASNEPVSGDVVFVAHEHAFRKDGRYADQPWAQEVPDPVTGQVWDSWLEMSPATAEQNGLSYNDAVELTTDGGTVTLAVQPRRGIADGVVVMAFGQGHESAGRYAKYGVNAAKLFTLGADSMGALSWAPRTATLKSAGRGDLVTAFSIYGDTDHDRNFGVAVNAEQLAETGDAPSAHPGEMTGIHHLALDARLQEDGIDEFYKVPEHATYRFAMTVDTNACTGCGACSIACYAENSLPIVGKKKVAEGREMGWIRINRYWETVGDHDEIRFVPLMCQQCGHAGCENVCPVLATYHNIDGLNAMVYNRCAGTRYCSNACPFSARRFNYHTYAWPEPFNLQLNPDVVARTMGVMEKCTFCVQRIRQVKSAYKDGGNFTRTVPAEALEQLPACAEACPSQALTFGNLKDHDDKTYQSRQSGRTYEPLSELNVASAVNYLARASFHMEAAHGGGHGGEHADGHDEGGEHAGQAEHHDNASHGADHGAAHGKADQGHDDHGKADDHHDDAAHGDGH